MTFSGLESSRLGSRTYRELTGSQEACRLAKHKERLGNWYGSGQLGPGRCRISLGSPPADNLCLSCSLYRKWLMRSSLPSKIFIPKHAICTYKKTIVATRGIWMKASFFGISVVRSTNGAPMRKIKMIMAWITLNQLELIIELQSLLIECDPRRKGKFLLHCLCASFFPSLLLSVEAPFSPIESLRVFIRLNSLVWFVSWEALLWDSIFSICGWLE